MLRAGGVRVDTSFNLLKLPNISSYAFKLYHLVWVWCYINCTGAETGNKGTMGSKGNGPNRLWAHPGNIYYNHIRGQMGFCKGGATVIIMNNCVHLNPIYMVSGNCSSPGTAAWYRTLGWEYLHKSNLI